jgi:hypothetical protein
MEATTGSPSVLRWWFDPSMHVVVPNHCALLGDLHQDMIRPPSTLIVWPVI